MDHLRYAAALAQLGDAAGYEKFRRDAIRRFSTTPNPLVAERIIKASLLLPADQMVLGQLVALGRVALAGTSGSARSRPPPGVVWSENAAAVQSADGALSDSNLTGVLRSEFTGLALASACSFDGRSIGVEFTEPVEALSATNPVNYTVSGTSVTNATLGEDEKTVVLWVSTQLAGDFSVKVHNVKRPGGLPAGIGGSIGATVLNLQLYDFATGQSCSARYQGGLASIEAGGEDIWEKNDHFVFACTKIMGDFDYRIKIRSIQPATENYARVGLMARDSLGTNGSRAVMVGMNAEKSFQVLTRTVTGGEAASQPPNPLPQANGSNSWVRLQRLGSVFHCYSGTNGIDWVELSLFDSAAGMEGPFPDPIYFGIATSSHSPTGIVTAVVSDLGINPDVNVMLPSALLEYRLGNYQKAAEWSRRCLSYPEYDPTRIAAAHVILAMSCWQLSQDDEAGANLLQGREQVEQHFQSEMAVDGATQGSWFDWTSVRILLREATALMANQRSPSTRATVAP